MKQDIQNARLLTTEEAAEILGFEPRTLVNMRSNRTGPLFVKIGARVRYRYADLMKYIDQNVVDPSAA